MKSRDLLDDLVKDLKPVKPPLSPARLFFGWALLNTLFLVLAITFSGNLRPGWTLDLLSNPRFLLEFIGGVALSLISGFFLFKHALPNDSEMRSSSRYLPIIILSVFTLMLVYSVFMPTKIPSLDGHRATCIWQLLGFSIPPLLILLYHLARNAPVNLIYVGFLAGVAASAPFATAMHIACMYDAKHILVFHIFPVIVLSLLVAIVARVWIRWWR